MQKLKEWLGLGYYESPLDQFLKKLDEKNPKLSASQRSEKAKYTRIFALRDNANYPEPKEKFWEKF